MFGFYRVATAVPRLQVADVPFFLATMTFSDYPKATLHAALQKFIQRFFSQQFKRSCMPDGPKVSSTALSPRTDWRMPSDSAAWTPPDLE